MNYLYADSAGDTLVEEMEISSKAKRKSPRLMPENSKRSRDVEDAGGSAREKPVTSAFKGGSMCSSSQTECKRSKRVHDTVKIKEGCPSDDELEGLALRIVEEWKALGRRLNFDKSQLAGFHKDNEKCSEKAYEMLVAWKQREDTAEMKSLWQYFRMYFRIVLIVLLIVLIVLQDLNKKKLAFS